MSETNEDQELVAEFVEALRDMLAGWKYSAEALPPLQKPQIAEGYVWKVPFAKRDYYTADQMRTYALSAIESARAAEAPRPVPWTKIDPWLSDFLGRGAGYVRTLYNEPHDAIRRTETGEWIQVACQLLRRSAPDVSAAEAPRLTEAEIAAVALDIIGRDGLNEDWFTTKWLPSIGIPFARAIESAIRPSADAGAAGVPQHQSADSEGGEVA